MPSTSPLLALISVEEGWVFVTEVGRCGSLGLRSEVWCSVFPWSIKSVELLLEAIRKTFSSVFNRLLCTLSSWRSLGPLCWPQRGIHRFQEDGELWPGWGVNIPFPGEGRRPTLLTQNLILTLHCTREMQKALTQVTGNFFFQCNNNKLLIHIPPFLPPPPKRKSWLNRSVDVNSGVLEGWEKRVADSFNGLRA